MLKEFTKHCIENERGYKQLQADYNNPEKSTRTRVSLERSPEAKLKFQQMRAKTLEELEAEKQFFIDRYKKLDNDRSKLIPLGEQIFEGFDPNKPYRGSSGNRLEARIHSTKFIHNMIIAHIEDLEREIEIKRGSF